MRTEVLSTPAVYINRNLFYLSFFLYHLTSVLGESERHSHWPRKRITGLRTKGKNVSLGFTPLRAYQKIKIEFGPGRTQP